jgi:arylsulfate sulfotransferase
MRPPGVRRRLGRLALFLTGLASGCGGDGGLIAGSPLPSVQASTPAANPDNVLSAIVTAEVQFADSAVVRYGLQGAAADSSTASVTPIGGVAVIPVLGLLPDSHYSLRVTAFGSGGRTATGEVMSFSTGALPPDLPRYAASGPNPSSGYVVFAAGKYGLVIDNTGRVVWYHRFPDGPGLNFMAQPTGLYVARPTTPNLSDLDPWVEIDPLGNVSRTFGCAGGLLPRFHDLIAELDGGYWLMCDETRTLDLSAEGGNANAAVTGTVVQHLSRDGTLLFQWSPFDHFAITDLEPSSRSGPTVNWTHGNSLDLDVDGNLIVSFRSLGEITKISTQTGDVLWRMGGLANQFTFEDTPMPAFSRQHGVRLTGAGQLVLLDNLGDPSRSQAERYDYDAVERTARLVESYGSSPPVVALLGGSTQDLPGEHTLVAYGNGGRVEEYDASGNVVWRIEGDPGYVFRAQRIASLYHPRVGSPR